MGERKLEPIVTTYPSVGGRGEIKVRLPKKRKMLGVATNVYLRENVRKSKKRYAKYENKGLGIVYAQGRY